MKSIKHLMLPLLITGSVGLVAPAFAEPTIIPSFQIAANDNTTMTGKTDHDTNPGLGDSDMNNNGVDDIDNNDVNTSGNVDRNNNGTADNQDSPGLNSLGDNTNDMADADDSENSTFDATFWVLMALLAVGIIAMIAYAARRRGTVH